MLPFGRVCEVDDTRMVKYKESEPGKYLIETYSVREREQMMGLPPGYVEKPLKRLFNELAQNAFLLPETSEGVTYRDFLPRDLWHFRKKCNFKCVHHSEPPHFRLALSSPQEGKSQRSFYTEDQYGKHLIGNGWSIPVAEHLLRNLTTLFADDVLTTYDSYGYRFPWEPYLSL